MGNVECVDFHLRFRRLDGKVWHLKELVDKCLVNRPRLTHFAITVKLLFSIGKMAYNGIYECVSRASVKIVARVGSALAMWRCTTISYKTEQQKESRTLTDKAYIRDATNILAST